MPTKPRRIKCNTLDIEFHSTKEASEDLGLGVSSIIKVLNEDWLHANGLVFTWLEF